MNGLIEPTAIQVGDATTMKTCCAMLYANDVVRIMLVGGSFHPGGLALTERLGQLLDLQLGQRMLDMAAGQGTSAIFLAQQLGCEVVGMDYGAESVQRATAYAAEAGVSDLVRFEQGDAEHLKFDANSFDAVICECAFCTFPNKLAATGEFVRVLRPGGRVGLSDLTCQTQSVGIERFVGLAYQNDLLYDAKLQYFMCFSIHFYFLFIPM